LMNGLKMKKDALFVMKKFYDFIIFYIIWISHYILFIKFS
jgi:hypothetical protein